MNELSTIQRIDVQQVDIDNAEGKKKCPIFQSIKREFGIETKVNFDWITALFDRACFGACDINFGQFGRIHVTNEMREFMNAWDKSKDIEPRTFSVKAVNCKEKGHGRQLIMDYYRFGASWNQRREIERHLCIQKSSQNQTIKK